MMDSIFRTLIGVALAVFFACANCFSQASPGPEALLQQLDDFPHSTQIAYSKQQVVDYEIGLGAIQKVGGEWRFKRSERLSGSLIRYTWQIVDGFSSAEVMAEFLDSIASAEGASMLFSCKGRACGPGAQWANRVFLQRELYGREDAQRYLVYNLQGAAQFRLLAYSSERTATRQYLHVELLQISPQTDSESADKQ